MVFQRRRLTKVKVYTNLGSRIMSRFKTQKQLAKLMGLSQQTVSKKLRGETEFMVKSDLEHLAKILKVQVSWFFEGYSGPPSAKPRQRRGKR